MNQQTHYELQKLGNVILVQFSELAKFETGDQGQLISQEIDSETYRDFRHVIVNCQGLKYANSHFLELLIRLANKVKATGGQFILCQLEPFVRDLIHVTHLDERWTVCDSLDDALTTAKNA